MYQVSLWKTEKGESRSTLKMTLRVQMMRYDTITVVDCKVLEVPEGQF